MKKNLQRRVPEFQRKPTEVSDLRALQMAQEEHQRCSERFDQICDATRDAMIIVDADGRIQGWNNAAETVFDHSVEEAKKQALWDLIIPSDQYLSLDLRKECQEIFLTGKSPLLDNVTEMSGVKKNKAQFPVEVTLTAIKTGESSQLVAIIRDISARKCAEAARLAANDELQHRQEYFASLIENVNDIILVEDLNANVIYGSPSVQRILGYAPEEFLAKRALEFVHPDDWAIAREMRNRTKNNPAEAERLELRVRHKNNSWMFFDCNATAQFHDGKLVGFIVILRDTTEHKHSEERLRKSEELFRTLAKVARVGIFMSALDGEAIYTNESWSEIAGLQFEQAKGNGWITAMHPDDREKVISTFVAAAEADIPFKSELRFVHHDGTIRWVLAEAIGAKDSQGNTVSYVGTVTDITEFKLQHERMRRVNRALATLGKCSEETMRAESEQELLDETCQIITSTGGYALAWIGFSEPGIKTCLRPVAYHGGDGDLHVTVWCNRECGPAANAVSTKQMQIVQNINASLPTSDTNDMAKPGGCGSLISLPLFDKSGNALGALTIYDQETNAFADQENKVLEELAADLSFGISAIHLRDDRNRAQTESQLYQKKLRQSLEDALQALAATTELRDPYTAGHQRRVAELATSIASELGLNEEQVHAIHLAAVVHDIGKLHIPAEILAKPTQLSAIEFELIKTHAQAGYEILRAVDFPWPIAEIVWQHHERLDGSGYPRGLCGKDILLETKIISVADVFEAMSSHRPYRAGLGVDVALEQIIQGRGTLYEPQVVDACVNLIRENRFEFALSTPLQRPEGMEKSSRLGEQPARLEYNFKSFNS
jgi:PAS domain S-box-containing protein/putative nucleotidyltransferase with HDIG domain